jgi:hypothetical protein
MFPLPVAVLAVIEVADWVVTTGVSIEAVKDLSVPYPVPAELVALALT